MEILNYYCYKSKSAIDSSLRAKRSNHIFIDCFGALRLAMTAMVIMFLMVFGLLTANAAVPHLINYQGKLTDSSGAPLNGSYSLTFRIYDAETAGNLLWEETQSSVVIQKGIFSVLLGSVTNLDLPFDKPYFLEIKVGNEVMSPRQRITSAGYAIRAENTERLNGEDSQYYKNASNINSGVLPITQGGTGRTTILAASQAVGTNDISAPASEADMPNMSITSATKGTKLLCMFTAPIRTGGGESWAVIKLYIDGVEKCKTKSGTWSGTTLLGPVQAQVHWLETGLTPGNHTVKIRWYYSALGYFVDQKGTTDGQRVLTVIDLD